MRGNKMYDLMDYSRFYSNEKDTIENKGMLLK
jgi:hypothetical protein